MKTITQNLSSPLAITILLSILCISYTSILFGDSNEYDNFNTLRIDNKTDFDSLIKHWKSQPNPTPQDQQRINDRIKAIQMTQKNDGKCSDYTSMVPLLSFDDHYFLEFSTMYGTPLDCQLHKELYQTRNAMNELTRRFPDNEYLHHVTPTVHLYAAYAKQEKDPFFAIPTHNIPINNQALLTSFKTTVEQAVSKGIIWKEEIIINDWQLAFDLPREKGLLPAIYHANFKPNGW